MKFRLSASLAATAMAFGALSACDGGKEAAPLPAPAPSSASPTVEASDAASQGSVDDTTPAGTSEPKPVTVDEKITDDVIGNQITVTQLVRDFPPPAEFSGITEDGGELVLVEIEGVAGEKFSGGIQGGFTLTSAGSLAGNATTIANEAMDAAGLTPFTGISSGESGSGWLCFQVNSRAETYELQYKRNAASVIGSDQTIDEKVWTVPLP